MEYRIQDFQYSHAIILDMLQCFMIYIKHNYKVSQFGKDYVELFGLVHNLITNEEYDSKRLQDIISMSSNSTNNKVNFQKYDMNSQLNQPTQGKSSTGFWKVGCNDNQGKSQSNDTIFSDLNKTSVNEIKVPTKETLDMFDNAEITDEMIKKAHGVFIDASIETVAQTICYINQKLQKNITCYDLYPKRLNGKCRSKGENYKSYQNRFNSYIFWLVLLVLNEKEMASRAKIITKYMELIIYLNKNVNYIDYEAIENLKQAINHQGQIRLKKTWMLVDKSKIKFFKNSDFTESDVLSHLKNLLDICKDKICMPNMFKLIYFFIRKDLRWPTLINATHPDNAQNNRCASSIGVRSPDKVKYSPGVYKTSNFKYNSAVGKDFSEDSNSDLRKTCDGLKTNQQNFFPQPNRSDIFNYQRNNHNSQSMNAQPMNAQPINDQPINANLINTYSMQLKNNLRINSGEYDRFDKEDNLESQSRRNSQLTPRPGNVHFEDTDRTSKFENFGKKNDPNSSNSSTSQIFSQPKSSNLKSKPVSYKQSSKFADIKVNTSMNSSQVTNLNQSTMSQANTIDGTAGIFGLGLGDKEDLLFVNMRKLSIQSDAYNCIKKLQKSHTSLKFLKEHYFLENTQLYKLQYVDYLKIVKYCLGVVDPFADSIDVPLMQLSKKIE